MQNSHSKIGAFSAKTFGMFIMGSVGCFVKASGFNQNGKNIKY